jgi:hypothetical protein
MEKMGPIPWVFISWGQHSRLLLQQVSDLVLTFLISKYDNLLATSTGIHNRIGKAECLSFA